MTAYVCVLRAVNLGSHQKIKMPELVKACESLGFENVRTYIQSGNIVFHAPEAAAAEMEAKIEARIGETFGFTTPLMIRTADQVRDIPVRNPFPESYAEKLAVAFLSEPPAAPELDKIDRAIAPEEKLELSGAEAFLYYPNGQGRSKMTTALMERRLGVTCTVRNWRTVNRLIEMCDE